MRIFLFGAGYSARAFSRLMTGEAERIDGTTRNEQNFPSSKNPASHRSSSTAKPPRLI